MVRTATAAAPRRPPGERARLTRERILAAGAEHFAERGYEGARLEDIAAQVGVSGPALLYHFDDKRAMYKAVLRNLFEGMLARVEGPFTAPGPLPLRIENAVREWVRFVWERPGAAQFLLREGASLSPDIQAEVAGLTAPLLDLLHRVFEEGRRDGHFREPTDPLHFAMAVAGSTVLFVAAMPRLLPDAHFDPADPAHLAAHEREVLRMTRRLLGFDAPAETRP